MHLLTLVLLCLSLSFSLSVSLSLSLSHSHSPPLRHRLLLLSSLLLVSQARPFTQPVWRAYKETHHTKTKETH